jgi:DtxR family Mn-dependent transcriptional regulator
VYTKLTFPATNFEVSALILAPAAPVNPVIALLLFALLVGGVAILAWPRWGVIPRLLRMVRMTERVLLEDALKQVQQTEEALGTATIETLAGALEVTRGVAVRLVEELTERGLARSEEGHIRLTEAGRAYALRIVRTHRLVERYLADRTGVAPAEWHDEAERHEHALSEAQAEALSVTMGNPRYDPHGDPIPLVTGEMPARAGRALSGFAAGTAVAVVHLEDEPREAFERLLALGLRPGARLRLLPGPGHEVRFRFDGREQRLPRVVADQITVEPLAEGETLDERPHATLADVPRGASARVVRLAAACQGPERRRLLDLGVVPDTIVTPEFSSPGGDPIAYRIRGALIALRRNQARLIQVELSPVEALS